MNHRVILNDRKMKICALISLCLLIVGVGAIGSNRASQLSLVVSQAGIAYLTLSNGMQMYSQISTSAHFSGCQLSNHVLACPSFGNFYGSAVSSITRGAFIQDFAFSINGISSSVQSLSDLTFVAGDQYFGLLKGNAVCQGQSAGQLCESCAPNYTHKSATDLTCVSSTSSIQCVVPSTVANNYKVNVDIVNIVSISSQANIADTAKLYMSTVITDEPSCVRSLSVVLGTDFTCPTDASKWMLDCDPNCMRAGVCHPCGLGIITSTTTTLTQATCKTLAALSCDPNTYFYGVDCSLCPWFVDNSDSTCTRPLGITYNVPAMATQASVACKSNYTACQSSDFVCADNTGLSAAGWCLSCVSKSREVSKTQRTCAVVKDGFNCAGLSITADCPCATNVEGVMCTQCVQQYSGYPGCATLLPNFNPDGTCKQDSVVGYWSAASNCTLCITGYYGDSCTLLDPWYENSQAVLAPTCSYLNRGNVAIPTDCSMCTTPGTTKVTGTYPNKRGYICQLVAGFNASTYPLTCIGGKDVKTGCTICPRGYTGTNCATFDTSKFILPAVSVVVKDTLRAALQDVPSVTPQCQITRTNDYCTGCNSDWVPNIGDCTSQKGGYVVVQPTASQPIIQRPPCAAGWDTSKDCLVCLPYYSPPIFCNVLAPNYNATNGLCVFTSASSGLPAYFDYSAKCTSCLFGFSGSDCTIADPFARVTVSGGVNSPYMTKGGCVGLRTVGTNGLCSACLSPFSTDCSTCDSKFMCDFANFTVLGCKTAWTGALCNVAVNTEVPISQCAACGARHMCVAVNSTFFECRCQDGMSIFDDCLVYACFRVQRQGEQHSAVHWLRPVPERDGERGVRHSATARLPSASKMRQFVL